MKHSFFGAVFGVALALCGTAFAQSAPAFNTDIPGKGYSPFTTPQGYTQVEVDLGNFSQYQNGSSTSRTFITADPKIKYGLFDNVDIEAAFGGYVNVWDRSNNVTTRLSGFGDITPRIRWNFINTTNFAAAALIGAKIPTASTHIGNGQVEYNFILPMSYKLPNNFVLSASPEVDVLNNTIGTGKQVNYQGSVTLSHPIYGNLSGFVEGYAEHGTDTHSKDVYTADTGLNYGVNRTTAVTLAGYAGLNRYSPEFQTVLSVAHRF